MLLIRLNNNAGFVFCLIYQISVIGFIKDMGLEAVMRLRSWKRQLLWLSFSFNEVIMV